jgi:hypothetical protein
MLLVNSLAIRTSSKSLSLVGQSMYGSLVISTGGDLNDSTKCGCQSKFTRSPRLQCSIVVVGKDTKTKTSSRFRYWNPRTRRSNNTVCSLTDGPTTKGPAMTEPTDKTRQARLAKTEPTDKTRQARLSAYVPSDDNYTSRAHNIM